MAILALVLLVAAASCKRPVLQITSVPDNTPPGSTLYVAGNFNQWDPGDTRAVLELAPDSNYYIQLPRGFGELQFKITRGDWSTVETDACGYDILNRNFNYRESDTLRIEVQSFKDLEPLNCNELTIVVKDIPEDTPPEDSLVLAGNFNEWNPDASWVMHRDSDRNRYLITLPRISADPNIEFKVTRGSLLTAEADAFGREIERRQVRFGATDTLFISVKNWEDIGNSQQEKVTLIIDKIPTSTPPDDDIYLAGPFTGWYPKDPQFRFVKNKQGKYQFDFLVNPQNPHTELKITRGDWSTEETDALGYKKNNTPLDLSRSDTIRLQIEGWLDKTRIRQPQYTILIQEAPETTPANASLFLAGNINGWNAADSRYRFTKTDAGNYSLTLNEAPRELEYKITRGSWKNEEADAIGQKIENRRVLYTGQDTVKISVENWIDIPPKKQNQVVIVLYKVPANTADNNIYIAGTFNNWNPEDPNYILNKNLAGEYYITIPRTSDAIAFKFTLGGWQHEELNVQGYPVDNRSYRFGFADTLRLKVEGWRGM
ncbi:MAG: hypothetical protein GX103_01755 [Bacteroidales bacterium]|nr:hypothetical protein [Bacteroidales bacterium]